MCREKIDNSLSVIEHVEIQPNIFSLKLAGNYENYNPGQFVQIEVSESLEPFLRRPISICDANNNTLHLVYRVSGRGTKLLSKKRAADGHIIGDQVKVLGPLGNGFPLDNVPKDDFRVLLIGGGIGVPPLLGVARKLFEKGVKVQVCLGFNSQENAILLDEFHKYSDVMIATLDGSLGHKGLVTDLLTQIESPLPIVYACGPEPLLLALERLELKGFYSLERRMACGTGVCLGCNITTYNAKENVLSRQRVCHDGPVFPIGSVKWGDFL